MFIRLTLVLALIIPSIALGEGLTDSEIDKFLKSMDEISNQMETVKQELDPELSKQIMMAAFDGKTYRTMITLIKGKEQYPLFEKSVINSGYKDMEEWAYVGDRLSSVLTIAMFVGASNSMQAGEDVIPRDANIFAAAKDDSIPEARRNTINEQLLSMCNDKCVVAADLEPVGRRYADIKPVLNP